MRLTLKVVNDELAKRGHQAMLVNGDGYFYFRGGEAADWLDRTIRVPTLSSLTLDQWGQGVPGSKKEECRDSPGGKTGFGPVQTRPDRRRIKSESWYDADLLQFEPDG